MAKTIIAQKYAVDQTNFLSQYQTAKILGISRGRCQQLEKRALRKIRIAIERECRALGISLDDWASH